MMNLQGSWVAMPTPFTEDNQVDIEGFKLLIARQIKYGTNQLFILGSAGEVTLLSIEEKKLIVKSVIAYILKRQESSLFMVNLISISNGVCSDVLNPAIKPVVDLSIGLCFARLHIFAHFLYT